MPVSKTAHKWTGLIASEFGIPEKSVWITDMTNERTFVYIWTKDLSKKDYERISGFNRGGGHLSTRGKLSRFLQDLNADGWFTKVKPNEATAKDLHPITPNVEAFRKFCTGCNLDLLGVEELQREKCDKCYNRIGF
jgi:hypothetical protein